jgi:hypothetical protein
VSAPAWLPDWTDATVYPVLGKTPIKLWGWEFLRRNPAYQQDWETELAPLIAARGKAFDRTKSGEYKFARWLTYWNSPAGNPFVHVGFKYGLARAEDPAFANPRIAPSSAGGGFFLTCPPGLSEYIAQVSIKRNEIYVKFDLDVDLFSQMEAAKFALKKEAFGIKFKTWRRREEDWLDYLRVLDAEAVEADRGKIGDVLYPNLRNDYPDYRRQERLRDHIVAAHRMRDEGYRPLLSGK